MKSTIIIEDTTDGTVAVTIRCEEGGRRVRSKRMFDLVEEAVRERFHPVKTHFVPVRKERSRR